MVWFKDWFDQHYLDLYIDRDIDDAQQQVELVCKYITIKNDSLCLDLGCGHGRYTQLFCQRGHAMVGIDISSTLIEVGRKMFPHLDLRFLEIDDLIKQGEKYNFIFSFFTGFGYYLHDHENYDFLKKIVSLLKDGGEFWLDFFNADRIKKQNLSDTWQRGNNNTLFYLRRRIENNRIVKKIDIYNCQNQLKKTCIESVRLYDINELKNMFSQVGLSIQKIFGDYTGSAFQENSPRLIIWAGK